jgi:hypothetical protein
VAASGSDRHPILRPTERADAHVDGMVFAITPLRSGATAWVYVFAG